MTANSTGQPKKRRGPGKPFQPGKSGNPSGRPKALVEVIDLAREHTPNAINALATIATDTKAPPAARVAASVALLDRGWGKPTQDHNVNHNIPASAATDAALAAIALAGSVIAAAAQDDPAGTPGVVH